MTSSIASIKHVSVNNRDMVIVTTVDGDTVWVPKKQFSDSAETITFTQKKSGDTYTNRTTGETGTLKADRNEFVGYGKQSKLDLFRELAAIGITPSISLS